MDIEKLLIIVTQAGTFIAAFAGVAASVVMFSITKKFGLGILATGFKTISVGVIFIAAALVVDAFNFYLQVQNIALVTLIKEVFLILGTYIIVVGAKKTADKLENLTK